jgi:hypothetical protein
MSRLSVFAAAVGLSGRPATAVVLEINVALWIMIGCAAMKAAELVQYLGLI